MNRPLILRYCFYCGAPFHAHEILLPSGNRAHRIDRPDQPQHGQQHEFNDDIDGALTRELEAFCAEMERIHG